MTTQPLSTNQEKATQTNKRVPEGFKERKEKVLNSQKELREKK